MCGIDFCFILPIPKYFGIVILPFLFKPMCKTEKQLKEMPFFSMKAAKVTRDNAAKPEFAKNIISVCVFAAEMG